MFSERLHHYGPNPTLWKRMFLHNNFYIPATAKNAYEELNLSQDMQTFINHDGCRGTAFSSAGTCMLNTESANLNFVGDHSTRLDIKHN